MPLSAEPRCALVCVGSELLRGKINTHCSHIARRLGSIGLTLNEENTVSDELPELTSALRRSLAAYDIVFVSGGLGPTFDDVTREAASQATGRPLILSPRLLRGLKEKFQRAKFSMPKANARQADVLEGARVVPNAMGTAPGQWLEFNTEEKRHKILILLPGPPRELIPMLEQFVLPRLKRRAAALAHAEAHLHFVGAAESVVDHKIRPIISREQTGSGHVQFTILAHLGLVDLDIFVSHASTRRAQKTLDRITASVRKAVGVAWYGSDEAFPLEKVVGNRLRAQGATLAVAESCTGGLLASRLTEIPGSSDYFVGGWVTYANAAKLRELGISGRMLKEHGAVSKPVAAAMARGVRQRAESTWGVGITGIAGPTGGTPGKPIGLVHIALASKNKVICRRFHFSGNREAVRQRAVLAALDLLRGI